MGESIVYASGTGVYSIMGGGPVDKRKSDFAGRLTEENGTFLAELSWGHWPPNRAQNTFLSSKKPGGGTVEIQGGE